VTLRVDNPSFHVAARFIDQLHPPLRKGKSQHFIRLVAMDAVRMQAPFLLLAVPVCTMPQCSADVATYGRRGCMFDQLWPVGCNGTVLAQEEHAKGKEKGKANTSLAQEKKEKEHKKEKLYSLRKKRKSERERQKKSQHFTRPMKKTRKGKKQGKANTLLAQETAKTKQ